MRRFFAFLIVTMISLLFIIGCCHDDGTRKKKADYDIVKVCSIGDTDGTTCVQYAAKRWYTFSKGSFLTVETPDGNEYDFNTSGWAILIDEK